MKIRISTLEWLRPRGRVHTYKEFERILWGTRFNRGDGIYFNHLLGGKIFGFRINELVLRMIVEPLQLLKMSAITFGLSILALTLRAWYPIDNLFFLFVDSLTFGIMAASLIIIISSISLFLEEFAIMQRGRDAILDMIDGELDMQQIMIIKDSLKIEAPKFSIKVSIINNF